MQKKFGIIFTMFFALVLIFSLKNLPAHASIADEAESLTIKDNLKLSGGLNGDAMDSYVFTLEKEINLSFTGNSKSQYDQNIILYDKEGQVIWKDSSKSWIHNNVTELDKLNDTVNLKKGTYYLTINNNKDTFISYNFTLKRNEVKTTTTTKIKSFKIGQTLSGIYNNEEKQKYKFKLTKKTNIKFTGTFVSPYNQDIYLYDKDGQEIWGDRVANDDWKLNNVTNKYKLLKKVSLKKGTYYIVVYNHSKKTLNYKIKTATFK